MGLEYKTQNIFTYRGVKKSLRVCVIKHSELSITNVGNVQQLLKLNCATASLVQATAEQQMMLVVDNNNIEAKDIGSI